ncbi:MAG TPA: phytanoyl-CoA dioxygenase family protein [Candidatus Xenobia bacterium]
MSTPRDTVLPGLSEAAAGSIQDLMTKGFVVLPGFLRSAEVDMLHDEYKALDQNRMAGVQKKFSKLPSRATLETLYHRFEPINDQIKTQTDICVNMVHSGMYFAIEEGIALAWHQDHPPYYMVQGFYDYLNFYMPIRKPNKEKSNVQLIPYDRLAARAPEVAQRIKGRGARRVMVPFNTMETRLRDGKTILRDDDLGGFLEIPFNLDELAFTPELEAGDLLVVRGDVLHRTQDADTDRVALSVRFCNADKVVSLRTLSDMNPGKLRYIRANGFLAYSMFKSFERCGQNEVRLEDYLSACGQILATPRAVSEAELMDAVAEGWLASHPDIQDSRAALSTLLQQLLPSDDDVYHY